MLNESKNNLMLKMVRKPTLLEACLSLLLRSLPLKHGAHRILDKIKPAPWSNSTPLVELTYKGRILQMDVSDLVGWHLFVIRSFDPEVTEIIERFAYGDERDVFWDIGANKGACSYEIATSLPLSRIVAIEPQRALCDLLETNLAVLAPGRHEVFQSGIGESPGYFDLVIPKGNRGRASLVGVEINDQNIIEHIEITTAESIAQQSRYGWPSIVKIDVEGFEPSVTKSLAPAFSDKHIRCCVFECHPTKTIEYESIRASTERLGYLIYAICKTVYATDLVLAPTMVKGATDYAIIRKDLC